MRLYAEENMVHLMEQMHANHAHNAVLREAVHKRKHMQWLGLEFAIFAENPRRDRVLSPNFAIKPSWFSTFRDLRSFLIARSLPDSVAFATFFTMFCTIHFVLHVFKFRIIQRKI